MHVTAKLKKMSSANEDNWSNQNQQKSNDAQVLKQVSASLTKYM